jgi:uncharacterized protein (TIGR03000 family)
MRNLMCSLRWGLALSLAVVANMVAVDGYAKSPVVPCVSSGETAVSSPSMSPEASYRQCNGVYFSKDASAWFNVDCLVLQEQASVGSFVTAKIPGVGTVRVWIMEVYLQPKLKSPPFKSKDEKPAGEANLNGPKFDQAKIVVILPDNASLTVNDRSVASPSGSQEVVVDHLEQGARYEYHLVATYEQDGQKKELAKTVAFGAGDVICVDFQPKKKSVASTSRP